jgi:hypothetical protein
MILGDSLILNFVIKSLTDEIYFSDNTKGQSESVYRRRTENTMAKRKSTKGQTTINKTS